MKRFGGWLGLAVIAVCAWIFLRSGPARGGADPRDAGAEPGAAPIAAAELVPAGSVEERAEVPVAPQEPPAAVSPGDDPAVAPAGRRRLHVRDLASGAELAGLELVEAPGFPESERVHPGSLARGARALGDSPVAVSDARTHLAKRTLHVRAPGHAWGRIQFENDFGGEKTLMLGLACTLEVEVVGQVRDPETRLRILGDSPVPIFDELLTGSTTLDSLPAGKHRVRAEIGEFWRESLRLDEAEVELSPERPARVTLTIEEPEVPPEVPLAGTLELPPEWNLADFELRFNLLDAVRGERNGFFFFSRNELQESSPGLYRFSLPAVQAGRYDASIQELAFHQELLVAPPGLTDARIRVGPPCVLVVRCYEADSGQELEAAQVHVSWTSEIPKGLRLAHNKNATRDEQRRAWIARVPLAKIIVSASGSGFVSARPTIETVAGVNELRLDLARTCDLRVVLREGAIDLAWDPAITPELVPLEGQVLYRSQSSKEGAKILHEKEPGLYTLRIPRIPGYEPIPEANVRLERGSVTEHVVKLVRLL